MEPYMQTPPDFNRLWSWVREALRRVWPTPLLYLAGAVLVVVAAHEYLCVVYIALALAAINSGHR